MTAARPYPPLPDAEAHDLVLRMQAHMVNWAKALTDDPTLEQQSGEAVAFLQRELLGSAQAIAQPPEAAPTVWRYRFPNGGKWHYTEVGPNDSSRPELTWQPLFATTPKGGEES